MTANLKGIKLKEEYKMNKLVLTVIIGIAAGIVDITPMVVQKMDKYSIISAFIHWVITAIVITHIQVGIEGWLKGLIVATIMALPIIILVMKTEPKSVLPILVMSVLLGSLVGYVGDKYVG